MSDKLKYIYDYLRDKLKKYNDDIFIYEDGFLKLSEDSKTIYVEFAETEDEVEKNLFEDDGAYDKEDDAETILQYIIEEFSI